MDFLEIKTKKDLCNYLKIKEKELNFLLYSKKDFYYTYKKKKRSGGERIISSPNRQLKYIQKMLKKGFDNFYLTNNFFKSVHGFIPNKSISTNAESHKSKDFVLNLDIKDFFPSISFHRIRHLLSSNKAFNFPDKISIMIANLVTRNNELPQGAPTSPVLSNIICHNMDKYFDKWVKLHDNKITYTRYADDITFSGNYDALSLIYDKSTKEIQPNIVKVIKKNRFEINIEKTRLQYSCAHQEVTGIKVNSVLNVSRHFLYKLRSMIHSWEKFGINQAYEEYCKKNIIEYDENKTTNYSRIVLGMLSYMKMIKGYDDQVYSSLALRVNTLLKKTIIEFKVSYDELKDYSVYQMIGNRTSNFGTCFRIKNYLVTCKHCVSIDDPLETYKIIHGGHIIEKNAIILYKSEKHDLALLTANSLYDLPYINLAKENIKTRNNVSILGYPMSSESDNISEQNGQVSSYQTLSGPNFDTDEFFIIRASIQQGNSGGPVLNNENDLVGMVCLGNEDDTENHRNGSLPLSVIKKEIETYEKTKTK